eukprot:350436-Chlamydomonas_euryale.AAC.20
MASPSCLAQAPRSGDAYLPTPPSTPRSANAYSLVAQKHLSRDSIPLDSKMDGKSKTAPCRSLSCLVWPLRSLVCPAHPGLPGLAGDACGVVASAAEPPSSAPAAAHGGNPAGGDWPCMLRLQPLSSAPLSETSPRSASPPSPGQHWRRTPGPDCGRARADSPCAVRDSLHQPITCFRRTTPALREAAAPGRCDAADAAPLAWKRGSAGVISEHGGGSTSMPNAEQPLEEPAAVQPPPLCRVSSPRLLSGCFPGTIREARGGRALPRDAWPASLATAPCNPAEPSLRVDKLRYPRPSSGRAATHMGDPRPRDATAALMAFKMLCIV